jgi:hypothetical protein
MEKIELKKARDFGELINDTFKFTRQNLKPLLKSFFTICGFFMLATVVLGIMQQLKMAVLMTNPQELYKNGYFNSSIFNFSYFLTVFVAMLNYMSISLTTLCFVSLYIKKGNQPPSAEEVWKSFKNFFLKFLGSSLVLNLLFLVGFMLCILPGIYLFPIIYLITAIIVLEDANLGSAFDRGFKLIKDQWFTTFGALIIITIIVVSCMGIVAFPISIIHSINAMVSRGQLSMSLTILTVVIQTLCSVFFILPIITISLSYFSLKEEKDGTGLTERINTFGQNTKNNGLSTEEY